MPESQILQLEMNGGMRYWAFQNDAARGARRRSGGIFGAFSGFLQGFRGCRILSCLTLRKVSMKSFIPLLFLLSSTLLSQDMEEGHAEGEKFFHSAGIAVRLVGPDSVLVTFGARSEDLQNTVHVFPYEEDTAPGSDTATFRLFERKLEFYLQERIPVQVDGRGVYLRVVQWKPKGKGREDRLDMKSLWVDDLFITLGGKIPRKRKHLDVTANVWVERKDAKDTEIQVSLFQDRTLLRRLWTKREKKVRFPVSPDSLKAMRRNPPPRLMPPPAGLPEGGAGDHSGHNH
jgi:hypothetical protein